MRGLGLTLLYAAAVSLIIYVLISAAKFIDQAALLTVILLLIASIFAVHFAQQAMREKIKYEIVYLLSRMKLRRKRN
ncbi:MAG: hypothetical protein QW692_00680 [Nitrososphaerota archaeon]